MVVGTRKLSENSSCLHNRPRLQDHSILDLQMQFYRVLDARTVEC